jgi:hypothetical protein
MGWKPHDDSCAFADSQLPPELSFCSPPKRPRICPSNSILGFDKISSRDLMRTRFPAARIDRRNRHVTHFRYRSELLALRQKIAFHLRTGEVNEASKVQIVAQCYAC